MLMGSSTTFWEMLWNLLTPVLLVDFQQNRVYWEGLHFYYFHSNYFRQCSRLVRLASPKANVAWKHETVPYSRVIFWSRLVSCHYVSLTTPSLIDRLFQSLQIQTCYRRRLRHYIQLLSVRKYPKDYMLFDLSSSQLKLQRDFYRQVFWKPLSEQDTIIWIENFAYAQGWVFRYVIPHNVFSRMINQYM